MDLPLVFGNLQSSFAAYLAVIRDCESSEKINDSVSSYQIKQILKNEFKVPAESVYIGPHAVKIADREKMIVWLVSVSDKRVIRQIEALGWTCYHFDESAWLNVSGYPAKVDVIRKQLKLSGLLDLS